MSFLLAGAQVRIDGIAYIPVQNHDEIAILLVNSFIIGLIVVCVIINPRLCMATSLIKGLYQ
jgi:hypothetical protein